MNSITKFSLLVLLGATSEASEFRNNFYPLSSKLSFLGLQEDEGVGGGEG